MAERGCRGRAWNCVGGKGAFVGIAPDVEPRLDVNIVASHGNAWRGRGFVEPHWTWNRDVESRREIATWNCTVDTANRCCQGVTLLLH